MKPFIVVGMPRTGSTLLLRALQQHPDIQAYGELFHWLPTERMTAYHGIRRQSALIGYDGDSGTPLEFLREWVWCPANAGRKAVGFKIFAQHAIDDSSPEFFEVLRREFPGLRVIHIQRRNYLDVFVSWLMAQQTGEWFVTADSTQRQAAQPLLAPTAAEAEEFFIRMEKADKFFGDLFAGDDYLPVTYEELSGNLQETGDRMFGFLGVGASPVKPALKKQIDRHVADILRNYGALRQHFAQTRFASLFPAPRPAAVSLGWSTGLPAGFGAGYRIQPPKAK